MYKLSPLFFLFYFLLIFNLQAQDGNWKLIKNESGIKVYSRPDTSSSSLKELKIVTEAQTSISGFVSLISDKAAYPKWVYRCASSELLKKKSDLETYHYQVTDMPWPVQNRDIVIYTIINQNPDTKEVFITCSGAPDYKPRNADYIRIVSYRARWKITPKTDNTVLLEYTMAVNPAGSIPDWLINMTLTDGPIRTIKNLKSLLPNYQSVKLEYIKN